MKILKYILICTVLITLTVVGFPKNTVASEGKANQQNQKQPVLFTPSYNNSQVIPQKALQNSLTNAVLSAEIIVLGTVTSQRYEEIAVNFGGKPGKRTYVIYTLSVEKVIKGDSGLKEVFIKHDAYVVSGVLYFNVSERVLACLHKLDADTYYVSLADVLWGNRATLTSFNDTLGRVINVMKSNKIPITLPNSEWPPLPIGPVTRPNEATLPLPQSPKSISRSPKTPSPEQQALLDSGWFDLMTEDFEGEFPPQGGAWTLYGNPTWDDDNYKPHNDYWSAWCAKGGTQGLDPEYNNYSSNMNSWMVYGPFDLSLATAAELKFWWWNESEENYDLLAWGASPDGLNFYGTTRSGLAGIWHNETLDLSNVPSYGSVLRDNSVWIAFWFTSDSTNEYKGAFIDDIELRVNLSGPVINNLSPTSSSAGTNADLVTINGDYFGSSQGNSKVQFYYAPFYPYMVDATVQMWSNNQIKVYVPRSASSGPLLVYTSRGTDQMTCPQ